MTDVPPEEPTPTATDIAGEDPDAVTETPPDPEEEESLEEEVEEEQATQTSETGTPPTP